MATKTITTELVREGRTFGTTGCENAGNEVRASEHVIAYLPKQDIYVEICRKCGGSGFLPEHGFVFAGVCFECNGAGLHKHRDGDLKTLVQLLDRRAADQARRDRKRQAERDAKQAAADKWKAANPEPARIIAEVLATHDSAGGGPFNCLCVYGQTRDGRTLENLCMKANREIPSEKQAGFIVSLYTEFHARKAKKEASAAARQWLGTKGQKITITGTVIYIDRFENSFGWSTLYLIADADGNAVKWFRTGWARGEKGDTVTVTATIKDLTESGKHGKLTVITKGTLHNPPN